MFTASFWKGAAERGIKTFLQSFVAVLIASAGADAIGVTAGLGDVNWVSAASVAALATILSLATSIGNADFTAGKPDNYIALDPGDVRRVAEQVSEAATKGTTHADGKGENRG